MAAVMSANAGILRHHRICRRQALRRLANEPAAARTGYAAAGGHDLQLRVGPFGAYLIAKVVVSKLTAVMPPPCSSTTAMPRPKSRATMLLALCLFLMPFSRIVCNISVTVWPGLFHPFRNFGALLRRQAGELGLLDRVGDLGVANVRQQCATGDKRRHRVLFDHRLSPSGLWLRFGRSGAWALRPIRL